MATYTYSEFARDIIALCNGVKTLTPDLCAKMGAKAEALLAQQENKAAYNATHKSKTAPKGASAETLTKAETIKAVLSTCPMTGAEINAAAGTDYTALQIANAVKYIPGVKFCKVVRSTVNSKGLKADKEYTAYYFAADESDAQ